MVTRTIEWTEMMPDGSEENFAIPAAWRICQVCQGEGSHVVDCVKAKELFLWSPQKQRDFLADGYETDCPECSGSGKVLVPAEPESALARRYLEVDFERRERVWEESNSERYD